MDDIKSRLSCMKTQISIVVRGTLFVLGFIGASVLLVVLFFIFALFPFFALIAFPVILVAFFCYPLYKEQLKKRPIVSVLFIVLGISLALYSVRFFVESREETVRKECLFRYVSKCGSVKMTEEEILKELNGLQNDFGLSKRKAKKLFLEAQEENQEFLDGGYDNTKDFDSSDKEKERRKALSRREVFYFERALKAVERMNDSSWLSP